MVNAKCPPECKVVLNGMDSRVKKLERAVSDVDKKSEKRHNKVTELQQSDYTHWESEVNMRPKTKTLLGIASVLAVITALVVTLFFTSTATWRAHATEQMEKLDDSLHQANLGIVKIQTQLENHRARTDTVRTRDSQERK